MGCFGLACLLGSIQCEGKKHYNSGGLFYCLIPAPKTKYCLSIDRFGINQQHMTFKGFNDSKRLLDWSQNSETLEVEKLTVILTKLWKTTFNSGIILPVKMRRCEERKVEILILTCNNQVNE